jgi:IS5 family transposase
MRPKKHQTTGSNDLFRARLDQIINLKHELVLLAGKVDWDWIDGAGYAHAKQFKRHRRQLRIVRSRLGRIIRDIRRKVEGEAALEEAFALPLSRATQIRSQQQRQRGWKLYSFHAPEVECIGKGKASAPYEFGVKASIVTNSRPAPGGQFVLHARALPDNPYDGHTLREVIDRTETLTGCAIERAYVDKGYCGHDAQNPRRIFISGQKRGVFGVIRRELRRRSAIKPIIGHLKAEGHLGRCAISKAAPAMPPTSSSPPSATISAASSPG